MKPLETPVVNTETPLATNGLDDTPLFCALTNLPYNDTPVASQSRKRKLSSPLSPMFDDLELPKVPKAQLGDDSMKPLETPLATNGLDDTPLFCDLTNLPYNDTPVASQSRKRKLSSPLSPMFDDLELPKVPKAIKDIFINLKESSFKDSSEESEGDLIKKSEEEVIKNKRPSLMNYENMYANSTVPGGKPISFAIEEISPPPASASFVPTGQHQQPTPTPTESKPFINPGTQPTSTPTPFSFAINQPINPFINPRTQVYSQNYHESYTLKFSK